MVGQLLRDVLLRGDGVGECAGPGASSGAAEHPVCGDHVQLSVRVDGGAIVDARWRAAGCPASMAVAALAAQALPGARVDGAPAALRAAIAAHGGLDATERHAEALVLRALAAALGSG
jgi:NifU-like protein involved in Fe-S cluster formation